MDWNLAIERNREALTRVLAMLVGMAAASPLAGEDVRRGEAAAEPGEGSTTLPRRLHRAILRLLRPAEAAARRLIIVMARGVTVAPPRPRKAKAAPSSLCRPGGTGILLPPGVAVLASSLPGGAGGRGVRTVALPLFDPPRRPFRPRRPPRAGVPRISLPGVAAPSPVALRRPPAPDDAIDATRLALRLRALGAALDDLPRQARRFARWRAASARARERKAAGAETGKQGRRRAWPLRPGRPPGQRPAGRRDHAVYDILNDLHGLAFDVLEHDTS
jgi:hypothetical protein